MKKPKKPIVSTTQAFDFGREFGELKGLALGIKTELILLREQFVKQNGRVNKLEDRTDKLESKLEERTDKLENHDSFEAGRRKGAWAFYIVLGSVLTLIVGALTFLATAGAIHF